MSANNSRADNLCVSALWCLNDSSNLTNLESGLHESNLLPLQIVFCFCYAIIFLLGTVGNIVTLTVILKTRYLHTKTNFYLCSLAVSDLLILLFGLPSEVAYLIRSDQFYGGTWLCILRGLISEGATNASVLTVAAFTLERWVAICKPFGPNQGSCGRVAGHITLIWLVALGGAVPLAYQFGVTFYADPCTCETNDTMTFCSVLPGRKLAYSFEISSVVFFATPMLLMGVVYVQIVRQLKFSFKLLNRPTSSAIAIPLVLKDKQNRQAIRSKTLVVKMLIVMAVAFFICYSPLHIQRLMTTYVETRDLGPKSPLFIFIKVLFFISGFLYYLSTTLNPLIYSLLSKKFRTAYNSLFAEERRQRSRGPECIELNNKQTGTLVVRRNIQTAYWRRLQQSQQPQPQQQNPRRRPLRNLYQTESESQADEDLLSSFYGQPEGPEKRRQTWPACPRWCRRSQSTNNSTPSRKQGRNGVAAAKTVTFILSDGRTLKNADERVSV